MKIIDYTQYTNPTEHSSKEPHFSRDLLLAASMIILPALILFTLIR